MQRAVLSSVTVLAIEYFPLIFCTWKKWKEKEEEKSLSNVFREKKWIKNDQNP